jgi:hypothetical protein
MNNFNSLLALHGMERHALPEIKPSMPLTISEAEIRLKLLEDEYTIVNTYEPPKPKEDEAPPVKDEHKDDDKKDGE